MGDPKGFLRVERVEEDERPVERARASDWRELVRTGVRRKCERRRRAAWTAAFRSAIRVARSGTSSRSGTTSSTAALDGRGATAASATNNFPEVTGRVCPAPCEASCVLNIRDEPVTIKTIERTIAEHVFASRVSSGRTAARAYRQARRGRGIRPCGPRGVAQQLARAGHAVTSSSATTGSGAFCATASPISRWRRASSTRGSSRCAPRG